MHFLMFVSTWVASVLHLSIMILQNFDRLDIVWMLLPLNNYFISSTLGYLNRLVSKYLARSELNAGQM